VNDRRVLYVSAFLRAVATGMAGVLLGVYLAKLGLGPGTTGTVVSAGLAGAATAALVVTLGAGRLGRKKTLLALALLSATAGAAFAFGREPAILGVLAFVGMLNGMGRDRGASLILEQSILPSTTTDQERTRVFAWYNVLQDIGHALGSLMAGLPTVLERLHLVNGLASFRVTLGVYAVLMATTAVVYLFLSGAAEPAPTAATVRVSPESRAILWRISSLFALDSLGGGFLTSALLAYFFYERFGTEQGTLGLLFFGARAANAISHLGAAWLAKRIGLVNTMVFTHIPSSLLLATVPFAPSFGVAALLFLLREGLVEMDVPTRQSYVMAVVRPEERTVASGVTSLVRMGMWAVAPAFAGLFIKSVTQAAPLFFGAGLKIVYDVLLYAAFRRVKPPEER
jgi:MFS family permease